MTLPPTVDDRLAALCGAYDLPQSVAPVLAVLLERLAADATAPTTVRDPERAVEVHIADSLDGLRADAVRDAGRIADIGAGAGFPGLVLAAALPGAEVTLVESAGRKCDFIRALAHEAGLAVAVVHARAEDWPQGREASDVVTARALAPLTVLVEYAAPLLRPGGRLVAWKGRRDAAEERDADAAAAATGLELATRIDVPPRPEASDRTLYVYSKVRETPARYPRRPGMARKRPITG